MTPPPCLETQQGRRSALCPDKLTAVIIAKTWPGPSQGPCHPVRHPRAKPDLILEGNQQLDQQPQAHIQRVSAECLGWAFPRPRLPFVLPSSLPLPLSLSSCSSSSWTDPSCFCPVSYQSPFMLRVTGQAGSCVLWGSGTKACKQQRKSLSVHWERLKQESKSGEKKPRVFSATFGKGLRMKWIKQKEGDSDPGIKSRCSPARTDLSSGYHIPQPLLQSPVW